jgi:hypothetical protein
MCEVTDFENKLKQEGYELVCQALRTVGKWFNPEVGDIMLKNYDAPYNDFDGRVCEVIIRKPLVVKILIERNKFCKYRLNKEWELKYMSGRIHPGVKIYRLTKITNWRSRIQ